MLARADSSPPRDFSNSPGPSAIHFPTPVPPPPSLKRKQSAISADAFSSPAPEQTDVPAERTETLVLPARNDLSSRPHLTISRFPTFPSDSPMEYHATDQLAMNRIGFRYTPAGISPPGSALPCRTIESLPTSYRVSWEDRSPFIKVTADGLGIAGDKGFRSARCNAPIREGKWYMEVRVEHGGGARDNVDGNTRKEGSHVRLGWARREAPLNGPVGLDGYSYGIRDKTGEKVTLSRPRPYGRPFSSGDVIGMYISLPPRRQPSQKDPHDPAHIKRERIPIEFKGQEYFESLEYPQSKEMISLVDYSGKAANTASVPSAAASGKKSATVKNLPERGRGNKSAAEPAPMRSLPTLPDSYIAFFINGECQGIAFQDLYDYFPLQITPASRKAKDRRRNREGTREHKENPFDDGSLGYYPFISLFNHARVRMNPGPNFDFPPPSAIDAVLLGANDQDSKNVTWRPICERYSEFMAEQWALDEQEAREAESELLERAAIEKADAQKQAQKERRRQQAEARRKAKKAEMAGAIAGQTVGSASATPQRGSSVVSQREGSVRGSSVAVEERYSQPALLAIPAHAQHGLAYGPVLHGFDHANSPAPTMASSIDIQGALSGYNSDNVETPAADTPDASVGYQQEHAQQPRQLQQWTEFDLRAM
jgi:COMPASS component BRE2